MNRPDLEKARFVSNTKQNDCGVCAIANAIDETWAMAAFRIFGASYRNKLKFNTKTKDIVKALALEGGKLIRVKRGQSWDEIPDKSIVKIIPSACRGTGNWHWVAWRDGLVWDSCFSLPISPHNYTHEPVSYVGRPKDG